MKEVKAKWDTDVEAGEEGEETTFKLKRPVQIFY